MPPTTQAAKRTQLGRAGLPVRAPEGLVTAIVAVTGVRDHVADVIVPGAFSRTLRIRKPKVVFHHAWTDFVGRTLHIEEWMPGDKRLPKLQKNGQPWPTEAGALVATMQFNMNVPRAREVWEWVRFYTESGECEFSIGYKVVPGKSSKGKDETRFIYDLDVFELSVVLFGAASETMTLEVKSLDGARPALAMSPAAFAVMEAKAWLPVASRDPLPDAPEHIKYAGLALLAADTGRVLLLQRALTPNDPAAGTWEFPGGGLEQGEHPHNGARREFTEETGLALPPTETVGEWDYGPYRLHAAVTPQEGLVQLNPDQQAREGINPDDPTHRTPEVHAWWDLRHLPGMAALRPEVAQNTDWKSLAGCVGGHVERDMKGLQTKTAAHAVLEAKALTTNLESKSMNADMTGSYEQLQHQLREAAEIALLKDGGCTGVHDCSPCLSVGATYPDSVVVSVYCCNDTTTYQIAYTTEGGQIVLAEPQPVTTQVVLVPADGAQAVEVDDDEAAAVQFALPATANLQNATALLLQGIQGKNLDELRTPVLALLGALAVKGMDVDSLVSDATADYTPSPDDVDTPEDPEDPWAALFTADDGEDDLSPEITDDAVAESNRRVDPDGPENRLAAEAGNPPIPDSNEEPTDVTLDPEAVRAQLDALKPREEQAA